MRRTLAALLLAAALLGGCGSVLEEQNQAALDRCTASQGYPVVAGGRLLCSRVPVCTSSGVVPLEVADVRR